MFVFKTDKVPFTGLHCTPERYPRLMSESQHEEKLEGRKKRYLHRLRRKEHLFKSYSRMQ